MTFVFSRIRYNTMEEICSEKYNSSSSTSGKRCLKNKGKSRSLLPTSKVSWREEGVGIFRFVPTLIPTELEIQTTIPSF